jgi:hypothetical protein
MIVAEPNRERAAVSRKTVARSAGGEYGEVIHCGLARMLSRYRAAIADAIHCGACCASFFNPVFAANGQILAKLPDQAIREVVRPESANSLQGNAIRSARSQQGPLGPRP